MLSVIIFLVMALSVISKKSMGFSQINSCATYYEV